MKIEKWLKGIIWTGIVGVLFVPLFVANNLYFPFITGKTFSFRLLVELIFFAWVALAFVVPLYRPKKSAILLTFSVFIISIFVSDIFGMNSAKSFWSNFERMEGWMTLVHVFAYFLVLGSMIKGHKSWQYIVKVSLLVAYVVATIGVFQLSGYYNITQSATRVESTLGNAAYMAVYMLLHIFFALFMAIKARGRIWTSVERSGVGFSFLLIYAYHIFTAINSANGTSLNLNPLFVSLIYIVPLVLIGLTFISRPWFYVGLSAFFSFILFSTATRGAILGFIGAMFGIAVLFAWLSREKYFKRTGLIVIAIGVVIVGGFLLIKNQDWVKQHSVLGRFASISLSEGTTQSRFVIWNMAYEGWKEKPIIGWGQESFNYIFNAKYSPKMFGQEQWFDRAHNVYLDWLVAGGIVGFFLYLSLFALAIYTLWKKNENPHFGLEEKIILTGALGAYFVHNIFVFDNLVSYILFFSILAYLHAFDAKKSVFGEKVFGKELTLSIVILAAIAFPVSAVSINYDGYVTSKNLVKAIRSPQVVGEKFLSCLILRNEMQDGQIVTRCKKSIPTIDLFNTLIEKKGTGSQEAREQAIMFSGRALVDEKVPDEEKQKLALLLNSAVESQIEWAPNDARSYAIPGGVLAGIGDNKQAIGLYKKALELSPTKQYFLMGLGVLEIKTGNIDEGFAHLKQAYELDKSFKEPLMLYISTLIQNNKFDEADQLLIERFGTTTVIEPALSQAYFSKKRFDKLVPIFEKQIEEEFRANKIIDQTYLNLSISYIETGRRKDAISILKRLSEISPSFKENADKLIKDIEAGLKPYKL